MADPAPTGTGQGMQAALAQEAEARKAAAASGGTTKAAATTGAPVATAAQRFTSRDPEAFPAVTGREEQWRFTPLDRLRGLHRGVPADGKVTVEVDTAEGVEVGTTAADDPLVGSVLRPADRVAAQALRAAPEVTVVRVPRGLAVSGPTTVRLHGAGGTVYGHLVVDVEEQASAVVVLEHTGSAVYAGGVEVRVGDGAQLTLVSLQDWERDAVHLGAQAARLGRDARYRSVVVTLGGDLVRLAPTVEYAAPGGDAELLGLAFADAGQHLEHRLLVDHAVRDCRSRVAYKGALHGVDAHFVWVGDVLIRAAATGTDTYELNRNLLLSDDCRADSVPNLEIETGEIAGAGHASATGRFDEAQLFYLMSRGIPEAEARAMVVRAFFAEVLQQIGVPELEERLTAAVEEELAGIAGVRAEVRA